MKLFLSICLLAVLGHAPFLSARALFSGQSESVVAPLVNLGPDRIACGSVVLDAGNPGAAYLWSTAATSQTITVTASGIYWVDVTDGTGTTRDSVEIQVYAFPAPPTADPVSICGPGNAIITAAGAANFFAWYNLPSGGSLLGIGDTIESAFTDSTTLFVEALNGPSVPFFTGRLAPGGTSGGMFFNIAANNERGILFDALEDFTLNEVTIQSNQAVSGTIRLRNSANVVVASWPVNFTSGGAHRVLLNVNIPVGNGYRLLLFNSAATNLFIDFPVTFPFTDDYIRFTGGSPNLTQYNYFYNWKVSQAGCASSRVPQAIHVLPEPQLTYPKDTLVCGSSTTIDVTNPGATYLWSTGLTTSSISLTASDTVSVRVSIGSCVSEDTFRIAIYSQPSDPVPGSVDVCGPGDVAVTIAGSADYFAWYDSAAGPDFLAVGTNVTLPVTQSTNFFVAAGNGPSAPLAAGRIVPGGTSGSMYYGLSAGNDRGIVFDALEAFTLNQVTIYANQALAGNITLRNSSNIVLATWPVNFPVAGAHKVVLNRDIPQGNGYRLMLANTSATSLYIDIPVAYPFTNQYVRFVSGFPNAGHYSYFYDWKVSQPGCLSNRVPFAVNVLPVPDLDLGADTVVCGQSLVLDASYPGASYVWSTGDTTATTTIGVSDTVSVMLTLGNCTVSDTLLASLYEQPVAPVIGDSIRCGIGTTTLNVAGASADYFVWYAAPTGDSLVASNSSYSPYLENTTTFYVEAGTGPVPFRTGRANIGGTTGSGYYVLSPGNIRGFRFNSSQDFILNQVTVYVDGPLTATVLLRNSQGGTLYSRPISLSDSGANVVNLNFDIPAGNNYELLMTNMLGAGLHIDIPVTYPINNQFISITGSIPIAGHYSFFYDWKISQPGCRSNRVASTVTVELPLNLDEYVYSCGDTLIDAGNPGATHLWSTGATTPSITVSESGNYFVQVSNTNGCVVYDSVEVEIPVDAGLQDDGILCGNTLITNYDASAVFLWDNGAITPTIDVFVPGTYSVVVNEPRGCVLYDTITVTGFDSFPIVNLGPDFATCVSGQLTIGNPGLRYIWSTGDTSQTITVTASGTYIGTAINSNDCATSDTVSVFVSPIPTAQFSVIPVSNFQYFFNNLSFPFSTYSWDFGDGTTSGQISPSHTYLDTGTFVVRLIASNSCGSDTLLDTLQVSDPVGIGDPMGPEAIHVFPNPASDLLYVDFSDWQQSVGEVSLVLRDPAGRLVFEKREVIQALSAPEKLDLSHLPAGMYYLQVSYGEQAQSWKISLTR